MRHVPSISQEAGEAWTLRVAFASSAEGRGGQNIYFGVAGGRRILRRMPRCDVAGPSVTSFLRGKIEGTNRVRIMSPCEVWRAHLTFRSPRLARVGRLVGRREGGRQKEIFNLSRPCRFPCGRRGRNRRDATRGIDCRVYTIVSEIYAQVVRTFV